LGLLPRRTNAEDGSSIYENVDLGLVELIRLTGMRESALVSARKKQDVAMRKVNETVTEHKRIVAIGGRHTRQKAIQDPVHGAILLDPWELDLVSSWEMLRLRYVKQLGPAYIVYPGATHTRFEHCLGTDFLTQKCIRVVNYCEDLHSVCFKPLSDLLDNHQQKVFRAAALLHDVGHPPTSHTIEFPLKCWTGLSHTDLGEFLIMHSGLTDILEQSDIEPRAVVDVLKRRSTDPVLGLISDFLDSPLDLDKTDYLIRDAHFSGVQLGIFPAERVMLTNRVVKNSEGRYIRAFMLKALHSLEALILSRNWMFSDLYLHHAVRVAEALTSKATYFRIKEEQLSKNECIGMFTRMTDADLYQWLGESHTDFVREYVARIRYRRLFKVALSRPIAAFEPDAKKRVLDMLSDIDALLQAELTLNETPGKVIVDIVNPELGFRFLSTIPLLIGTEDSGLEIVSLKDTDEGRPLVQALSQQRLTIPSVRVYSDPEIAGDIRRRFDKEFPMAARKSSTENDIR
jgi:HD superfamily phosphohydrolase